MRYGVILAGGGGTRLWPASRRRRPKPLLPLAADGGSLLAATVRRAAEVAEGRVVIVTAADQAEMVRAEVATAEVLVEPVGRNTAAAVGLAAVHLLARDPDAVLCVLPADHHGAREAELVLALGRACEVAASEGRIVSVGIVPTRAETGFGYLELGDQHAEGVRAVRRFIEKPDAARAQAMVAGGGYLWNAGIFVAPAGRFLADIDRHMPGTALRAIGEAIAGGDAEARTAEVYPALPSVSIDYGVLERTTDLLCVAGDFGWNDVGAWSALAEIVAGQPVAVGGPVVEVGARGTIAYSDPGTLVAVIGIDDVIVVQSGDAVLVVPRARAQDVREAVAAIERAGLGRYL
jgi:mannose-1-phosphate guanylyltransferase